MDSGDSLIGHIIKQRKVIEELVTKAALVKFCDLENNVFCYTEIEFTKDSILLN